MEHLVSAMTIEAARLVECIASEMERELVAASLVLVLVRRARSHAVIVARQSLPRRT
jgi:hypothetical protein